ncbi:MAG TPA: hypothetical protein VF230_12365 [Acidimicrobiales bacterium]
METTQTVPLSAIALVAIVAAAGSLFLPVFGTMFAVAIVYAAARFTDDPRNQAMVRLAAVVTACVAVVHVGFVVLVTPA